MPKDLEMIMSCCYGWLKVNDIYQYPANKMNTYIWSPVEHD